MKNVRFTTPIQQLYNNPSHEGGPLYRIKSLYIYIYIDSDPNQKIPDSARV